MPRTPHVAAERLLTAVAFMEAARNRDFERAGALWPELCGVLGDDVYLAAVDVFAETERWRDAADVLTLLRSRPADYIFKRNLFRNFEALKHHRPALYRTVLNVDIGDAYQFNETPSGVLTIASLHDGKLIRHCPGADPRDAVAQVLAGCASASSAGTALALSGLGDGYVLTGLAARSAPLALGRQQALFVFEPDARLLFACLLLHDFTGPNGPIEQERVRWYVGPHWASDYRIDALTERYLPFPAHTIKLNPDTAAIDQVLNGVLHELGVADVNAGREIKSYYAQFSAEDYARALSGRLDRPPRVTLLTTRFSTVLQHSTHDTAAALRQLGFETQTLIEPSPWHALHKVGMRRSIADFKPDLVMQIDHHRFEHGDLLPTSVPFVNWVQDMLPHLMSEATGRRLGERDFALLPSMPRWIAHHAYPPRQCLEFRKLARMPAKPPGWKSEQGLIVYVSNWSQTSEQVAAEMERQATGIAQTLIRSCCREMIDSYSAGSSLATTGAVRQLVERVCVTHDCALSAPAQRKLVNALFDRMNNTLYRQQGLAWASTAAEKHGLTLAIYGSGWETNPHFARYARGTIGYGGPLEELTRRAAVNLVLEPYVCIAHQRLLDALAAGGFCLTRDHPNNHTLQASVELLSSVCFDATASNVDALRRRLAPREQATLEDIVRRVADADASPGEIDTIALVHALEAAGVVVAGEPLLPGLATTTFDDAAEMARALARFAALPAERNALAAEQRAAVEKRFSYEAGMGRMMRFVEARLREESQSLRRAA